ALRGGKDLASESGFIIGGACSSISSNEKQTLTGTWRVGASSVEGTSTGTIVVPQDNPENNGYVNVTMILERENVGVRVKAMYFDGTDVLTDSLRDGYDSKTNWWEKADNEPRLKLYERMGSKSTYLYFDNFLVYVPKAFDTESTELSADSKSVTMKFNAAVDRNKLPTVTLTDENGEYDCVCQAGAELNELLVDLPHKLHLEENSYYLTFRNIRSRAGEVIKEKKILIGKDYVQKLDMSATKTSTGAVVTFNITPGGEEGDVYAMAILFKGNNIIDFKPLKVTLDSSGVSPFKLDLSGESGSVTRVQAFMIDSPENMRIISEVVDIEL
ncbi:MAG: hypothetical protein ACI4RS_03200, partial [Monoglobaceae bacterium]